MKGPRSIRADMPRGVYYGVALIVVGSLTYGSVTSGWLLQQVTNTTRMLAAQLLGLF